MELNARQKAVADWLGAYREYRRAKRTRGVADVYTKGCRRRYKQLGPVALNALSLGWAEMKARVA